MRKLNLRERLGDPNRGQRVSKVQSWEGVNPPHSKVTRLPHATPTTTEHLHFPSVGSLVEGRAQALESGHIAFICSSGRHQGCPGPCVVCWGDGGEQRRPASELRLFLAGDLGIHAISLRNGVLLPQVVRITGNTSICEHRQLRTWHTIHTQCRWLPFLPHCLSFLAPPTAPGCL